MEEEKGPSSEVKELLDRCLQALAKNQDLEELLEKVDGETAAEVKRLITTAQVVQQAEWAKPSPGARERGRQNFLAKVEKKKNNKKHGM